MKKIAPSDVNQKQRILIFFICVMFILFGIFITLFLIYPEGSQASIFFEKTNDYMADYFNVAKFSSDRNPYYNEFKGSYFPISYVIFYFLSKLAPYDVMTAFEAGRTTMGLATSTYFMFFLSTIFFLQLFSHSTQDKQSSFFIVLTFLFSGISFFAFERGNLIILAAILVSTFISTYDSPNRVMKEMAFLALAFAAALKVYPALLGLLLIYEKKYSEALRLIIYGILIAFLPFLFFEHGLLNAVQLLKNMEVASDIYKFMYYPRYGFAYFVSIWANSFRLQHFISKEIIFPITSIVFSGYSLLGLFLNAYETEKWKQVGFLIFCIIFLPVNSGLYCGLYVFPIIIMFFNQKHLGKKDWLYVILFLALLNPIQIPFWKININTLLQNIAIGLFLVDFSWNQAQSVHQRMKGRL